MRGPVPRVASIVPPLSNDAESSTRPRHPLLRGATVRGLLSIALLLLACSAVPLVSAVRIPFQNCLSGSYIYTNDKLAPEEVQLQFVPLVADAVFAPDNNQYRLSVTVWGNVTGRVGNSELPPPGDSQWDDPKSQLALNGKIQNSLETGPVFNATTLRSTVDVLNFQPYFHNAYFCESLLNGSCPLGPVFHKTINLTADPYSLGLPSFNLSQLFDSSYAFSTFVPTLTIIYGDKASTQVGCVTAAVTPTLESVAWSLRFLPLVVLILVGLATVFAAIFSPWGTSDVFHWTSNHGRDPDLLRLVTPGFGDCLNYIQFVVLTGSLSLDYPGFYQPAVSQASWSVLMFNDRFASKAESWQSVVDGIYHTPGEYGLERIAQLVGLGNMEDIWVGMIIWLLAIIAAVLFLTQVGFLLRWLWRIINGDSEEDLRSKNIPFSLGNVIRIVFNYFLVPIVALSAFQLVVRSKTPGYLVALAVVTLVLIIGIAVWLMHVIVTTHPPEHLSDDLPTVLLYGPLYNTYKDGAAWFALVPIILNIIRGAVIGGAQPSGAAQVSLLAICELSQVIVFGLLRPYDPSTFMNAYQVIIFTLRFFSIILMVPFTPLGVPESQRGWIGYAILFIHGFVLAFGFLGNALFTIFEVVARLYGAGGDDITGQTRGPIVNILNARQLKRRVDRARGPSRLSQLSSTAMLNAAEDASRRGYGRVRSESAGSMGIMMGPRRNSSAMDTYSVEGYSNIMGSSTLAATTPREASTFSFPSSPGQATRPPTSKDPWYRPPRARRGTIDEAGPASLHRANGSMGSIDLTNQRSSQIVGDFDSDIHASGRATPAPVAYAPVFAPRADYSTREADFYYNIRGPALNSDSPGRRLVTGPADPTSPVATATGWMMRLFGGKTKDKVKGFEVVRSARMPAAMKARGGDFSDDPPPEGIPVALGVLRSGPIESDDEDDTPRRNRTQHVRGDSARGNLLNDTSEPESDEEVGASKVSKDPPLLPDLDAGESFHVPSRIQSKASRRPSRKTNNPLSRQDSEVPDVPEVPRKSSKRNSHLIPSARLPFDRSNSQERPSTEELSHPSTSVHSSLDGADERPANFGQVHQRNVSTTEPCQGVSLLESTAEVVNDHIESAPSSSRSKQP